MLILSVTNYQSPVNVSFSCHLFYRVHISEMNVDGMWEIGYFRSHFNSHYLIVDKRAVGVTLLRVEHCLHLWL